MIRHAFPAVFLFTLAVAASAEKDSNESSSPRDREQYMVTLFEYRLVDKLPPTASEGEILDKVLDANLEPSETLRILATSGTETMANFGRRVNLAMGTVSSNRGVAQRMETVEVGTILRLKIDSHPKGAIADIDYSNSRVADKEDGGVLPMVITHSVQSTHIYDLKNPRLLSCQTIGEGSCIIMLVKAVE